MAVVERSIYTKNRTLGNQKSSCDREVAVNKRLNILKTIGTEKSEKVDTY